jgi:hypothetical protein
MVLRQPHFQLEKRNKWSFRKLLCIHSTNFTEWQSRPPSISRAGNSHLLAFDLQLLRQRRQLPLQGEHFLSTTTTTAALTHPIEKYYIRSSFIVRRNYPAICSNPIGLCDLQSHLRFCSLNLFLHQTFQTIPACLSEQSTLAMPQVKAEDARTPQIQRLRTALVTLLTC